MSAIAEIFRVGGANPVGAAGARSLIAGLEQRIGSVIPETFRQFLELANGAELLRRFSNCDNPIPFLELGGARTRWNGYDPFRHKVLPFMYENQGVCTWAIPLDQGDDPHVLVEVDSGTPPQWEMAAESFSLWLECQIYDWPLYQTCMFAAQAPELDATGLALMRSSFNEGNATYAWPGRRTYRFWNARSKLLLWDSEGQCDWHVSPLPGTSWNEVLADLSSIPGLVDTLYGINDEHDACLRGWKAARP
jgi:hypothetical protein